MAQDNSMPTDQELKEFQALQTQDERCAYFHAHPALARIWRAAHFPKPGAVEAAPEVPTKT